MRPRGRGRGERIRPYAEGPARPDVRVLCEPVSPGDLLRAAEPAGGSPIGPFDPWPALDRLGELAPSDGNDAAGPADLLFFRSERHGFIALSAGLVRQPTRRRIEGQDVSFLRVLRCGTALHHVQAEVERVAPEDIANALAAHDHHLQSRLLRDRFQPGGAHLTRLADTETLAGNDKR